MIVQQPILDTSVDPLRRLQWTWILFHGSKPIGGKVGEDLELELDKKIVYEPGLWYLSIRLFPPYVAANLSEARGRGTIPQLDEDSLARPGQQGSLADRIRARNAAKVPQNDYP